jgi:hypothetical protein
MTSLGIRRFYNRWTRLTREKHSFLQVNYILRAFSNVSLVVDHSYDPIFLHKEEYAKKVKAIEKLVSATKQKISIYLGNWH